LENLDDKAFLGEIYPIKVFLRVFSGYTFVDDGFRV